MGTYPVYGYRRAQLDKHHLVIDEGNASLVRRIFEMRASGMGFHAIAVVLNEEGIQPPLCCTASARARAPPAGATTNGPTRR